MGGAEDKTRDPQAMAMPCLDDSQHGSLTHARDDRTVHFIVPQGAEAVALPQGGPNTKARQGSSEPREESGVGACLTFNPDHPQGRVAYKEREHQLPMVIANIRYPGCLLGHQRHQCFQSRIHDLCRCRWIVVLLSVMIGR